MRPSHLAAVLASGLVLIQAGGAPVQSSAPASVSARTKAALLALETAAEERGEDDGTLSLTFAFGGVAAQVYQEPGVSPGTVGSLQFNVGFDLPNRVGLNRINDFNSKRKHARVYIDGEGDPFLVSELIVGPETGSETIKLWLAKMRDLVPIFVREVVSN
ncbi:MAG: YbjN domain-containing protein [Fimbriimonadaceae bacterium]|nr:YbjN domain-containing protein [Fimbriimonadaceae bacterium]